jgi:hypothetical protein
MPSETVNMTLSLTVHPADQSAGVEILSLGLQAAVRDIPELVSGTVSIYSDEFLDSEDVEPAGDVHIVETTGTDVGEGIRQAFTRGEEKGLS